MGQQFAAEDSSPRLIRTVEHGHIELPLDLVLRNGHLDLYQEVIGRDYLKAFIDKDRIRFQAGSVVGLIPLNSRLSLSVEPRVAIQSLESMLSYAGIVPKTVTGLIRSYGVELSTHDVLIDVVALSFVDLLDKLESVGLVSDYVPVEYGSSFPNGRIQLAKTLLKWHVRNIKHKAAISRFERTVDIPVNQFVKSVLSSVISAYESMPDREGRKRILNSLLSKGGLFESVSDTDWFGTMDSIDSYIDAPPHYRECYRELLTLCRYVAKGWYPRVEFGSPDITAPVVVVNMDEVFEDYVFRMVGDRPGIVDHGWIVLNGNKKWPAGAGKPLLWDPPIIEAKPDIVILSKPNEDELRSAALVMDCKYKELRGKPERSDINQVVAYAVSYGCDKVVLISPCSPGSATGMNRLGSVSGIELSVFRLDLSAGTVDDHRMQLTNGLLSILSAAPSAPSTQ